MLAFLGVTGRSPVEGERKYLNAWAEMVSRTRQSGWPMKKPF